MHVAGFDVFRALDMDHAERGGIIGRETTELGHAWLKLGVALKTQSRASR